MGMPIFKEVNLSAMTFCSLRALLSGKITCLIVGAGFLLLTPSCSRGEILQGSLLIRNARVVLVDSMTTTTPRDILINGDSIVRVTPVKSGVRYNVLRTWDAGGAWVIPGLWDMHAHPDDPEVWRMNPERPQRDQLMPLFVLNGVTGIRDMAGSLEEAEHWRTAYSNGDLLAPVIFAGGPLLDGPDPMWDGSVGIDNIDDVPVVVDSLINAGVDFLKVYSLLPADIYYALSDYANKLEFPFVGHVPFTVTPTEAARTGMKSQEHLLEILKQISAPLSDSLTIALEEEEDRIDRSVMVNTYRLEHIDERKLDSVLNVFKTHNTWHCPTLSMWYKNAWYEEELEKDRELINTLPSYLRLYWTPDENDHLQYRDRTEFIAVKKQLYGFYEMLVKRMNDKGIPLLAGTDMGANPLCFPGTGVHNELEALVHAGLSPGEALKTATIYPVRFLNVDKDHGSIEKGRKANLVFLKGNPLEDISNTRNIMSVIRDGVLLDSAEIVRKRKDIEEFQSSF